MSKRLNEGPGDLFDDDTMRDAEKGSRESVGNSLENEIYQAYSKHPATMAAHETMRSFTDQILRRALDQISDKMIDLGREAIAEVVSGIPDVEQRAAQGSLYDPKDGPMAEQFAEETDAYMELTVDLGHVAFQTMQSSIPDAVGDMWPSPIEFELKEFE